MEGENEGARMEGERQRGRIRVLKTIMVEKSDLLGEDDLTGTTKKRDDEGAKDKRGSMKGWGERGDTRETMVKNDFRDRAVDSEVRRNKKMVRKGMKKQ